MKRLLILITVIFTTGLCAEETNPAMKKIDDRLEELKTIWRQDTAIINKLTNFKRTPVQEGTQAYYKCLEASKRIQQAEAEAKTLKEKKKILESGGTLAEGTASNGDVNENYAVVNKDITVVTYDRTKHGPKVKDLFIGMSMNEFSTQASKLVEEPFRTSVALQDAPLVFVVMQTGSPPSIMISKGTHLILPSKYMLGVTMNEGLIGMADEQGYVKAVIITGTYAKVLFKAGNLSLDQFVETFEKAYSVDLEVNLDALPITYNTVTKEGTAVSISSDFGVTLSRGTKPEDTEKAFD